MDAFPEAVFGGVDFGSDCNGGALCGYYCNFTSLFHPSAITIVNNTCFISDSGDNRVVRIPDCMTVPSYSPADAVFGQSNLTNCIPGTGDNLFYPQGVAVDGDNNLWVGDTFNFRIVMFPNALDSSSGPNPTIIFGTSGVPQCSSTQNKGVVSLTVDPVTNTLFAADVGCNRILIFNSANTKKTGGSADFSIGSMSPSVSGSGACNQNSVNPQGVFFDPSTNSLFASDLDNERVLIFLNVIPSVNNPQANMVLGQNNFTTCENSQKASPSNFGGPGGLMFDPTTSTAWVSENDFNRVSHISCNASKFANIIDDLFD